MVLNKKRADNCMVLDWKVQTTASRSLREACTHAPTFEDWTGENASSVMTGCDGSCRTGVVVVGVGGGGDARAHAGPALSADLLVLLVAHLLLLPALR